MYIHIHVHTHISTMALPRKQNLLLTKSPQTEGASLSLPSDLPTYLFPYIYIYTHICIHTYTHINQYNGVAKDAKLAFDDISIDGASLSLPSDLSTYLFPHSAAAGARVHSNSWGST